MDLNQSNKHQYLQDINCSYILHYCLADLNSSSITLTALILYFDCFFKRGNVFNTLNYPKATTIIDGQHVAKSSLDDKL